MITELRGDLLAADVDALVNTVNTVGVMGKGIALQFRRRYPELFADYSRAAKSGQVQLGRMYVWETDTIGGPRYVINFPTKGHWRSPSVLTDIESGLDDLVKVIRDRDIRSIAIPPLGCGNGGLDWAVVRPVMLRALDELVDVDVRIFAPGAPPSAASMRSAGARPRMTPGRAALIRTISGYGPRSMGVSLVEVQKLMYFLQVAGEPLRLDYHQGRYGPYADNLRHVLREVEGHYLSGYGDGSSPVLTAEPIEVLAGADSDAESFLTDRPETAARIAQVLDLVEGFESMYGLELLASTHWIATHEVDAANDAEAAAAGVASWTPRKAGLFSREHVRAAWEALRDRGWLAA